MKRPFQRRVVNQATTLFDVVGDLMVRGLLTNYRELQFLSDSHCETLYLVAEFHGNLSTELLKLWKNGGIVYGVESTPFGLDP